MRYYIFTIFFGALASATPLFGTDTDEPEDMVSEMIHSSLPLYNFEWEDFLPRSYSAPDILAGCESRVAFGDWQFTPTAENEFGDSRWYQFRNYGAFHCAAIISDSYERDELEDSRWEYGFFVKLGETHLVEDEWELWAIQLGIRPGSQYVLLARPVGDEIVDRFVMLQQECQHSAIQEVTRDRLAIWSTRYCSVNSRTQLLSLASRMLRKPHLGTIQLVPDEETEENLELEESDSSE